jgi:glycosyltransferase involved in cell wall biosynthesis
VPENSPPVLPARRIKGPTVSVIMPTFGRAHVIGETIRTLLDGSWKDFELLVRDDGDGTDGTAEAVAIAASGDPRVTYHRNENQLRMPANLNAGIMGSTGDFIAVCHDHDLYQPNFLTEMMSILQRNPSALFVHCAIEVMTTAGTVTQTLVADWPELTEGASWLKFMLRSLNCPVCALTLVRRNAHEQFGLYDPSYGFIADVEMWMRLSSHGDVAYVREPLIRVREREDDHIETKAHGGRNIRMAARINRHYLSRAYDQTEITTQRLRLDAELLRRSIRNHVSRVAHNLVRSS